jgi:hypothetical protein
MNKHISEVRRRACCARWKKHPWVPPMPKEELERLYWGEFQTQQEIADAKGISLKRVQTAMLKFGIKPRRAVKRDQRGPANSSWKGSAAGYQAKHLRVQTLKGKPRACEVCGTTDPEKTYDWANLTGDYDSPRDYQRMCRSCHRRYDNARRKTNRA